MNSVETLTFIREWLNDSDRLHAVPLLDAITDKAEQDAAYRAQLERWLTHGGTLLIRDDLARPFQDADFIRSQSPARRYPWEDAWMALDSAILHARVADGRAPPFYQSSALDA